MIRVIKIGGSLLDLDGLQRSFAAWSENEPPALELIVCGGGKLVDAMRDYDAVHQFDSADLHWKCVELLRTTSWLFKTLLSVESILDDPITLKQKVDANRTLNSQTSRAIVTPPAYYLPGNNICPTNWTTTSDSLAALLAKTVRADELVLCKSTGDTETYESPAIKQLQSLVDDLLVDAAFPQVAAGIPCLQMVNLRNS